jgi:hypothetical protein
MVPEKVISPMAASFGLRRSVRRVSKIDQVRSMVMARKRGRAMIVTSTWANAAGPKRGER